MSKPSKANSTELKIATGISFFLITLFENIPYATDLEWIRAVALASAPIISAGLTYFVTRFIRYNECLTQDQEEMLDRLNKKQKKIKKQLKIKTSSDAHKSILQQDFERTSEAILAVYDLEPTKL
jgi:hypothetical protein